MYITIPEVKDQCKIGINFSSADVVACVEVANRFIKNDFAWGANLLYSRTDGKICASACRKFLSIARLQ